MKRLSLYFILLAALPIGLLAQNERYYGGAGRGDKVLKINNIVLSDIASPADYIYLGGIGRGDIALTEVDNYLKSVDGVYVGGNGRGNSLELSSINFLSEGEVSVLDLICQGGFGSGDIAVTETSYALYGFQTVYKGGIGRGDKNAVINDATADGGNVYDLIYVGGIGRGDVNIADAGLSLNGVDAAYAGGNGRGDILDTQYSLAINDLGIFESVYLGGIGRGDIVRTENNFLLGGYGARFVGGNGRGDISIVSSELSIGSRSIYDILYFGGVGRGDISKTENAYSLGGIEVVYVGGNGRGDNVNTKYINSINEGNLTDIIYSGGGGRGDISVIETNYALSGVGAVYFGGNGRGDILLGLYDSTVSGNNDGIFMGGVGRGDISLTESNFSLGGLDGLFVGGNGRGDKLQGLYFISISGFNIYAGGVGRGDISRTETNYLLSGLGGRFAGGIGRGDIIIKIPNTGIGGGSIIDMLYSGGIGRGDVSIRETEYYLSGLDFVYYGGNGRGDIIEAKYTNFINEVDITDVIYSGGIGRGDNSNIETSYPLSGVGGVYFGGIGRGDNLLSIYDVSTGGGIDIIYTGGIGRGDVSQTENNYTLGGFDGLFVGGNGRGDRLETLYSAQVAVINLYAGGLGRGDISHTETNNLLSGFGGRYFGGIGRGDISITSFGSSNLELLYAGGVGRGDMGTADSNLLLAGYDAVYVGGNGRGDKLDVLAELPLGNSTIYTGGVGRGDISVTETSFSLSGVGGVYFGGIGRGDILFSIFDKLVTGDDIISNIYYGGIGRGDFGIVETSSSLSGPDALYVGGNGRGDMSQLLATIGTVNIYTGGVGRGDFNRTEIGFLLNGVGARYLGGVGRGDISVKVIQVIDPDLIYTGGIGRGDVSLVNINLLLGGPDGLFVGGNGRGDNRHQANSIPINEIPLFDIIYNGGDGRGDYNYLSHDSYLDGTYRGGDRYRGGSGRGDIISNTTHSLLDGTTNFNAIIYGGGIGRGDISILIDSYPLAGSDNLYNGGDGRGDIENQLDNVYINETGVPIDLLYVGGMGRGDASHTEFDFTLRGLGVYFGGDGRGDVLYGIEDKLTNGEDIYSVVYVGGLGRGDIATGGNDYPLSGTDGVYVGGSGRGDKLDYVKTLGINAAIWLGTLNNDWANAGNWGGNILPAEDGDIIFGYNPINDLYMDADHLLRRITNASATRRLVTNGHILKVSNDFVFTNGAQIDASAIGSAIEMDGIVTQIIPAGLFVSNNVYNLIINNAPNVRLSGTINIMNELTTLAGKLDVTTNLATVNFVGTSAQTIGDVFLNNRVYNLTIDNPAGVTINNSANTTLVGTLTLKNTLTVSGAGRLDADSITLNPAVIYSGVTAQSIDDDLYLLNRAHNLIINNTAGVTLNTDFAVDNVLTINPGKKMTIPTEKYMYVDKTFTNNAGISGLLIKASVDGSVANGSLVFNNVRNNPVSATVEMYDKASGPAGNTLASKFKWQYFGIPFRSLTHGGIFNRGDGNGSYVRRWNHSDSKWYLQKGDSILTSFTGYEIAQPNPKVITFTGVLENGNFTKTLDYNGVGTNKGQYLFANPYTAAIDITKLEFTDGVEKSVYLFNTGSTADWTANGGVLTPGNNPGQYVVAPKQTAGTGGIPSQIPSMQGFLVNDIEDLDRDSVHIFSIPYSAVVTKNTAPLRTRSNDNVAKSDKVYSIIDVKGSRFGDRMWLFTDSTCNHDFNNGWDGRKVFGTVLTPQLYAVESDGDYQINAVNDINNTDLAFQAGEDTKYKLTFSHTNTETHYAAIYLVDMLENVTTDITLSGSEYAFEAASTEKPVKRFKIITVSATATSTSLTKVFSADKTIFVQNFSHVIGDLYLYDIAGRFIQKSPFGGSGLTAIPVNLPVGPYVVKAVTKLDVTTSSLIIK